MGFDLTTFAFEVVNFLVLLYVLNKLIYKPLLGFIAARREELAERERHADQALARAEASAEAMRGQQEALSALRDQALSEAREEAADERARILEQAREDASAERARVSRLLETEREARLGEVRELSIARSAELAGRLLFKLLPDGVDDALTNLLAQEVKRRGRSLVDAREHRDSPLIAELTFARLPGDDVVARLRSALEAALEVPPRLSLQEDPALIAGPVLRLGSLVLDASLAGQVSVLRERARNLLDEGAARA